MYLINEMEEEKSKSLEEMKKDKLKLLKDFCVNLSLKDERAIRKCKNEVQLENVVRSLIYKD